MTLPAAYQAALDLIYNYVDYERRRSVPYDEATWDLGRTQRVLATLGNPHKQMRFVHVAGSKGKGSTAAMIEAVLRASGLRTGLYTSPHLHTFRERIRVDGQLLTREALVQLLERCRPAIDAVPGITTFEIMTVLALLHFAQERVAWAVLETGLGGRLDATNVVTPAVSVITPIGFEHTALLGDTLAEIAREKAGIVKSGVPVVSAPQASEALDAIQAACIDHGSRLVLVGRDWHWQPISNGLGGQIFDISCTASATSDPAALRLCTPATPLTQLHVPLLGAHQLDNATTAVAACHEVTCAGVSISENSLRNGLGSIRWPGRLEVLQRYSATGPAIIVDAAHSKASARMLRQALATYFPGRALRLVFGASSDKDVDAILAVLAPAAELVVLTRSRHPRAAALDHLARSARRWQASGRAPLSASSVADSLDLALAEAGPDNVVCLTGSLFVAAEGREAFLARQPDALPLDDWAREAEPPDSSWQVAQTPGPAPAVHMEAVP